MTKAFDQYVDRGWLQKNADDVARQAQREAKEFGLQRPAQPPAVNDWGVGEPASRSGAAVSAEGSRSLSGRI